MNIAAQLDLMKIQPLRPAHPLKRAALVIAPEGPLSSCLPGHSRELGQAKGKRAEGGRDWKDE